jgi:hypothetical protein
MEDLMNQPIAKDEEFLSEFERLEKMTAPPFARPAGRKLNFRPT